MGDVQVLIFKLAAIILIAIVGYVISVRKTLGPHGKDVVSLLLNRVALPLMIITAYIRIKIDADVLVNAAYVVVIALLIYFANYSCSNLMAKYYKLTPKQKSVYINGGVHSNTAFLAFPLLFAVYGDEGLLYATVYYMVDNILLTTTGMRRLMHESTSKRKLAPVTIALFISLPLMIIANFANIDLTNNFIYEAANDLGGLTTPLAFLFIGVIVYETKIKELFNKEAVSLIFAKMTFIPLVFTLILYLLKLPVEGLIIIVVMTQSLMPPFSALLSMSYEYEQDVKTATSIVVLGHIYSIISIPLIFTLLVYLFG